MGQGTVQRKTSTDSQCLHLVLLYQWLTIILMDPEATSQRSSLRLYPDSDFMDCAVTAGQMEGQAGAAGP